MTHRSDQAATLRAWAENRRATSSRTLSRPDPSLGRLAKSIAIGGGKGGVGKTALAANLACTLGHMGARTIAVDADLGLSNLDLAFGVQPKHTVLDVVEGIVDIEKALVPVAPNVTLLAGTLGRMELVGLPPHARLGLTDALGRLHPTVDWVVLDMPSGVGEHVMHFAQAASHVVVMVTPEPTALADAYAFVKVLRSRCGVKEALCVANMVRSQADGERIYDRLAQLCDRFLGVNLGYLGALCLNQEVSQSVRVGRPFVTRAPDAFSTRLVEAIAVRLLRRCEGHEPPEESSLAHQHLWNRQSILQEEA